MTFHWNNGHLQKLAIFREYANNLEEVEIRATLRQLNLLIGSARNKLLYPKLEEKRIKLPKDELSREQIERLVNDVEVIVNWVRQKISENLEGNFWMFILVHAQSLLIYAKAVF